MAQYDPLPEAFQAAVIRKEVSMLEAWSIIALIEEADMNGQEMATLPPNLLPACRVLGLVESEPSQPTY